MIKRNLIIFLSLLLLTSCSIISKPEVVQGNIITAEMVSRLHPGMTPPQVVEVMGTPVLSNVFSPNRMEYVYTFQGSSGKRTEKRVSCVFQNGILQEIKTIPHL